tara:strand:+ start:12245 stop:13333 length:1089 start_codon:yes stop_codon:yes gene_type:complete
MNSYKELNKQINNYLQALIADKNIFESVEKKRIKIATNNLTPKNKTLIEEEYEKTKEEANAFKSLVTDKYNKYDINQQLMDVIKYIKDNLYNDIKKLGADGTRLEIQGLTIKAERQIEQLRNDISVFTTAIEDFNRVKERPVGSANSIIPESNPSFINYVSKKQNTDILLVPLPDNSGFNLMILDDNGKINKESGVIPLSEFSKSMAEGEITGYFEQVPDTQTLDLFYKDMDDLVASLMQTDAELKQQTGKGLFSDNKKSKEKEEEETQVESITFKQVKDFFNKNPQGKQMLYSFLEDESNLGYYKNLQYSEYIDKNKPFTSDNYLQAIENYLVSKFNVPVIQQEQPQQQEQTPIPPENIIA